MSAAASGLYVALFVAFEGPLERQQVLHALHGHLGSGVSAQQDVALKVGMIGRCGGCGGVVGVWRSRVGGVGS